MTNKLSVATILYLNAKQCLIDEPKMSLVELTMIIMKQCKEADIPYNNIPVHIAFQSHDIKLEPTVKPDKPKQDTMDDLHNASTNITNQLSSISTAFTPLTKVGDVTINTILPNDTKDIT